MGPYPIICEPYGKKSSSCGGKPPCPYPYAGMMHIWATPFCFPFGLFDAAASPKRETFAFSMVLGKLILNFI